MARNEYLRQQRILRNWRQQDVADQLDISVMTVQRWERGSQQPGPYHRAKLCALFGLNSVELGFGETAPPLVSAQSKEAMKKFRLWTIPYARNPHFTGRDELLELLSRQLSSSEPGGVPTLRHIALTQTQIIKGLGGIGKTQIAIEYAYRARDQGRYTHTLWIAAASEETLMTSFLALARLLPEVSTQHDQDQQKLVQAVKHWLEQCEESWLLIVDNADDLSLVQPYLPVYGNGCVLFTTRATAVGSFASSLEVDTMGIMEGTQLLLRRARRFKETSDEGMNEATSIVVELGQFPLALDQAGAYIEETGCSVKDYLALYREHRHSLLARRGQQMTGYPESVATTWALSFQRVEQSHPAAAELLQLCALLAPDHIPEELLLQGTQHWPVALRDATADLFRFNQILEPLLAFSLVKRLAEDRSLSMHRLVQAVQVERMQPQEQRQWTRRLVSALNTLFPQKPRETSSWSQCARYLEQVQVCDLLTRQHQLLLPEGASLLGRAGNYLSEHAMYALAEELYQRALSILEQQQEVDQRQRAFTQMNLASLYVRQSRHEQARSLLQQALRFLEQREDENYLQIVRLLYSLATIHNNQSRYEKAELLYQRALRMHERIGGETTDVASVLGGLSWVYLQQGKYEQAEQCSRRALHIREQLSGPEHLSVAFPLLGLAAVLVQQGRFEEAEALGQRALHLREQYLGPEHPDVAMSLHELARLRLKQNKYEEAEPLYRRSLSIRERHLEPENLLITDSLLGLANLSLHQQRYAEAEPLYQRVLRIRERHLGSMNPDVAVPLLGLANLSFSQGKYEEAEPLYQRVLSIYEQASAPRNSELAEALYDFARFRQAQKRFQEAVTLYQRTLVLSEQVLGTDHPFTKKTRAHLQALLPSLS